MPQSSPTMTSPRLSAPSVSGPFRLAVGRRAEIAYRLAGACGGTPWLVLHGGPGSGCPSGQAEDFDLSKQWVVLPDQRGAGQSRPKGMTAGNHTAALVADLEALRRHLRLTKWSVLAGSWGACLALCYAHQYPDSIERLVLRGAFAATRREAMTLFRTRLASPAHHQGNTPFATTPGWSQWPGHLQRLSQLFQFGTNTVTSRRALRHWSLLEQAAAIKGVQRSLRHSHGAVAEVASAQRRMLADMKRRFRRDGYRLQQPGIADEDRQLLQKFRIQAHYLRHRCFIGPGELDQAVQTVARHRIACLWLHGRHDRICPPRNSQRWLDRLHALGHHEAEGNWPNAGHLGSEPELRRSLHAALRTPS